MLAQSQLLSGQVACCLIHLNHPQTAMLPQVTHAILLFDPHGWLRQHYWPSQPKKLLLLFRLIQLSQLGWPRQHCCLRQPCCCSKATFPCCLTLPSHQHWFSQSCWFRKEFIAIASPIPASPTGLSSNYRYSGPNDDTVPAIRAGSSNIMDTWPRMYIQLSCISLHASHADPGSAIHLAIHSCHVDLGSIASLVSQCSHISWTTHVVVLPDPTQPACGWQGCPRQTYCLI